MWRHLLDTFVKETVEIALPHMAKLFLCKIAEHVKLAVIADRAV